MALSNKERMQRYRIKNPGKERARIVAKQKEKQVIISAYKIGKG